MTEEEKKLKALTDGIDAQYKEVKDMVEAKADTVALDDAKTELLEKFESISKIEDESIVEYVKSVQEHFNTLEEQVKDIVQKGTKSSKHPEEQLDEWLTSENWKTAAKLVKRGEKVPDNVKVLTVGSDLTAGNNPVILPMREPGVSAAPRARTPITDLVQRGTVSSDKVSWIERTLASESPGTAMKAENTEFGESDALWTEVDISVKKITDRFRATVEILEDTDFVRSEIMSMLTTNIPHKRETQILKGSGAGVNMTGLITSATAFSLPTGAESVVSPNAVDALKAVILQVQLGYNGSNAYTIGFQPNFIALNPINSHNIGNLKDADGKWLLPGWNEGRKVIDGVPVIASTDVTVGVYLVGDAMQGKYFTRRGMQIKFWDQYDTDPAFDRVMFTATERGALRVTNVGAYGLVTGTLAAALAAITP